MIIVTSQALGLDHLRRMLPAQYSVEDTANQRIVIELGGRRVYLGTDPRVAGEMDPEEAACIEGMIPDPAFHSLDFNDISMCRELLLALADRSDVVVYNDHGLILPGSEFVQLLREHQDWDWRCDPAP
ncbi:MAG TPA: hypothetical protein VHP33_18545 [Polyangiaceae bacterium]|nr:hypothetical protein [Polyangiaceae bacterium]